MSGIWGDSLDPIIMPAIGLLALGFLPQFVVPDAGHALAQGRPWRQGELKT
jgi:hypothetical protein